MITNNSLSREHIKYILGIDVPLNESIALHQSTYELILERQLIYESFLTDLVDSLKQTKVGEKVVNTINNLLDFKIVLSKLLTSQSAIKQSVQWVNDAINTKLQNVIDIVIKYIPGDSVKQYITGVIEKIKEGYNSLSEGWKKFLLGVIVISTVNYLTKYIKTFTLDKLKKLFKNTLLESIGTLIKSILENVTSYFGIFGKVVEVGKEAYELLQPFIEYFKEKLDFGWDPSRIDLSKSRIPAIQEIRKLQRRAGIYL
jgi:hypothetical protein